MTWIKCSERMPEYGVLVFFRAPNSRAGLAIGCRQYTDAHGEAWRGINECHITDLCEVAGAVSVLTYRDVTHWQPLPEPPNAD